MMKSFPLLLSVFFQPVHFRQAFDGPGFFNLKRPLLFLKITLPLFLFVYPVTCILQIMRLLLHKQLDTPYVLSLLGPTALLIAIGLGWGLLLSSIESTLLGIMIGIALAISNSLSFHPNTESILSYLLGTSINDSQQTGFIFAIIAGLLFGLTEDTTVSIGSFVAYGVALGLVQNPIYGIAGGCALGIAGATAVSLTPPLKGVLRLLTCGVIGSIVGFVIWFVLTVVIELVWGISSHKDANILSGILFLGSYLLGYCRLPLYPLSAISGLRAYRTVIREPATVFSVLQRSSLYRDERMYLPFPYLKELLVIALAQDYSKASDIIEFILSEKSQQSYAVQKCVVEVTIEEIERLETLRHLASSRPKLTNILTHGTNFVDVTGESVFTHLVDILLNAKRYVNSYSWQAKYDALQDMMVSLRSIHPIGTFESNDHNGRLEKAIGRWMEVIECELDELKRSPQYSGRIYNPYNPGPVLNAGDTLFVGRRDLVRKLSDALNMGNRRPTFLLRGERRMGKSSTLKQLPNLLGARHLPVYYDLQSPSIFSSTQAFFNHIAKEIYEVVRSRGISVQRLDVRLLKEAAQTNDAVVYEVFDSWLDAIESHLQQEDRILLLALDEFEQLEEGAKNQQFPLTLLLNWFRNCIQKRSHVALLFSGVQSFSDVGKNWSHFFVNVQTLRVTFLYHDEAYQLITQPVPDFPGEQIFKKGIAEEIIRVTGGHPFIIQALCAALIDYLNTSDNEHLQEHDIVLGMHLVFKNWGDGYFRDLWERTSAQERVCLQILKRMNRSNLLRIERNWGETTKVVRLTLDTLQNRDLVVQEGDYYRIAAPIFSEWVERYG